MTLEEQIKALLEANKKEEDDAEDKEDADSVEDDPAVSIDNPMNPDLVTKDEAEDEKDDSDETEEDDDKKDVKESVQVGSLSDLLSEEFSEEFKLKAQTIFEAAVKDQVAQFKQTLQEEQNATVAKLEQQFEDKLAQRTQQVQEDLSDKIDGYLGFLAEEWKQDNKVALETGIKSELTESFMGALKQVFEQHYLEVPTDKVDLFQKVVNEKAEVEETLSTVVGKVRKLQEQVEVYERAEIIEESVKGLTDLDAEKLKTLVEDFEFVDADTFQKKVSIVKTSFFEQRSQRQTAKSQLTEELVRTEAIVESHEPIVEEKQIDPAMAAYLKALTK